MGRRRLGLQTGWDRFGRQCWAWSAGRFPSLATTGLFAAVAQPGSYLGCVDAVDRTGCWTPDRLFLALVWTNLLRRRRSQEERYCVRIPSPSHIPRARALLVPASSKTFMRIVAVGQAFPSTCTARGRCLEKASFLWGDEPRLARNASQPCPPHNGGPDATLRAPARATPVSTPSARRTGLSALRPGARPAQRSRSAVARVGPAPVDVDCSSHER
jgi:hypothetical protein